MKASYKVREAYYKADGRDWVCEFRIDGKLNQEYHGTGGTGINLYRTEAKAYEAGARYLDKMREHGFQT